MGTITGFTAERMLEIEQASIVDGDVVGDNLILKKKDGTEIDAGLVRGKDGLVHKGTWTSNGQYVPNDAVVHEGQMFRAKIATPAVAPDLLTPYVGPSGSTLPKAAIREGKQYVGSLTNVAANNDVQYGSPYKSHFFQIDIEAAKVLSIQQSAASIASGNGEHGFQIRKADGTFIGSIDPNASTVQSINLPSAGRYYLHVYRNSFQWDYDFTVMPSSNAYVTPTSRVVPALDVNGFELLASKGVASGALIVLDEQFVNDNLASYVADQGTSKVGLAIVNGFLVSTDVADHSIHTVGPAMADGKSMVCFERQSAAAGSLIVYVIGKYIDDSNFTMMQFDTGITAGISCYIRVGAAYTLVNTIPFPVADVEAGDRVWMIIRNFENRIRYEVWNTDPRLGGVPTGFFNYRLLTGAPRTALGKGVAGKGGIRLNHSVAGLGRIAEWLMVGPATIPEVF